MFNSNEDQRRSVFSTWNHVFTVQLFRGFGLDFNWTLKNVLYGSEVSKEQDISETLWTFYHTRKLLRKPSTCISFAHCKTTRSEEKHCDT